MPKDGECTVDNQKLRVKANKKPRESWAASFKKMATNQDDKLMENPPTDWESEEWEGKDKAKRKAGALKGKIKIEKDFNELPDDIADAFGMKGK
jgi:hypothetical protein